MDDAYRSCENTRSQLAGPPSPPPELAPPPYTDSRSFSPPASDGADSCHEDDSDDHTARPVPKPMRVTINAAHQVQGSCNLLPINPTGAHDAARIGAALAHTLEQIQNSRHRGRSRRRESILHLDLTINCGITVVGHRNVIGPVTLKERSVEAAATTPQASATATVVGTGYATAGSSREPSSSAGAKRKANREDSVSHSDSSWIVLVVGNS